MPSVTFHVRWPDGFVEHCYSPSSIIKNYFEVGRSYTVPRFLELCREGLHAASDRVRLRYGGHGCSHAMAQLAAIEMRANRQGSEADRVRIEGFVS